MEPSRFEGGVAYWAAQAALGPSNLNLHARLISVIFFVLLAGCGTPGTPSPSNPALVVTIPYNQQGKRDAYIDVKPPYPFYVLLTNTGRKPLKLWDQWNSWGFFSLQLEVIGPDGQKHLSKKKQIQFLINAPTGHVLRPGEAEVWDVELATVAWENLEWIPKQEKLKTQVRAIYSVVPDEETQSGGVWTGRATSRAYDFTIYPR